MRKFAIIMSTIVLAGLAWTAQTMTGGREFYKVYASVVAQQAAGTGVIVRTDAELATITNNYKSQTISLVIDDGKWYVSNNIVFPTNITVTFQAGSSLDTSNSAAVTFLGGFSAPQNQQIFYGNGTFVSPSMVISNPAWWGMTGDPVALRVADNSITSAKIVDGTITGADVASGTLTGTNIADNSITSNKLNSVVWSTVADIATNVLNAWAATNVSGVALNGNNTWTGTNTFSGTFLNISNDMDISYLGYPKIPLTTNLLTVTAVGGATAPTISSYTNVFDSDMQSYNNGTVNSSQGVLTLLDFGVGTNYSGFLRFKVGGASASGSVAGYVHSSYSNSTLSGTAGSCYFHNFIVQSQGATTNTLQLTFPINGRYAGVSIVGSVAAGTYALYDISVYATTNVFRNMGGF